MTGPTGRGGPSENPPLEHLRAAALEFVRAGQVLLALAEKTLEDPGSGADVVRRLADTGRQFFGNWTGPGFVDGQDSGKEAESGTDPVEGHGHGDSEGDV